MQKSHQVAFLIQSTLFLDCLFIFSRRDAQAGRSDEAWREFNLLLTIGFPNQLWQPEFLPMERCEVYDKMRLFLQREKKFDLAVRFRIWSCISWAVGLHRQKRNAELKYYISRGNIEANVITLLKKAKKLDLKNELVDIVIGETKQLPNVDFAALGRRIDTIIFR
jgi:hypothetical protein